MLLGDVSLHVHVLSESEADQHLLKQLTVSLAQGLPVAYLAIQEENALVCATIDGSSCRGSGVLPTMDNVICTRLDSGKDLTLRNVSQGLQFISVSLLPELEGSAPIESTCNANGNEFELPSMLDIGLKVNSDKVSHHGYHRYYAPALSSLRNSPVRLLEIGLLGGGSLKLWKAFFPRATIVGVDNGYQTGQLMDGAPCEIDQCRLQLGGFDIKGKHWYVHR